MVIGTRENTRGSRIRLSHTELLSSVSVCLWNRLHDYDNVAKDSPIPLLQIGNVPNTTYADNLALGYRIICTLD